ncbi:MAG: 2-oxoglutarate dehydrogenase E1 component [Burkholderiales bacterium]
MKQLQGTSYLYGANAPFIEEQYENYLADPNSVSDEWKKYFDELQKTSGAVTRDIAHTPIIDSFARLTKNGNRPPASVDAEQSAKQVAVLQLINAHRFRGNSVSDLDPLQRQEKPRIPELELSFYELTEADLDKTFNTGSLFGPRMATLREILQIIKATYCGTIGLEYMHISENEQKRWLQQRFESVRSQATLSAQQKKHLLERLTAAETLEKYLHTRYVGQKRFSLEGGDTLIPIMDELMQRAGEQSVKEIVIGMAHRGRLNVLVNNLGKLPQDLFSEFEGKHAHELSSGDVKYHQGFSSDVQTKGGPLHLTLAFNPSHLEIVNPVVEGSVRARQKRRNDMEGKQVLPILLHGDAAFAGQGVVMETLNLSQTRGYRTGGTVHIVVNNQIGFTTSDPRDTRSTLYCTDIAKSIEAPVFHVNGDDPEACILVTQIALDYRMTFRKDVVIDMVCFRKLGHNEQDEPLVTQPLMYKKIAQHPGTRKLYADRLAAEKVIGEKEADEMVTGYRAAMDAGQNPNKAILHGQTPPFQVDWGPYTNVDWKRSAKTAVPLKELKRLAEKLTTMPADFKLHSTVERMLVARRQMGEGALSLDWGMAENLAYASLINDGFSVRLSGQDCGRGTFSHRHAVFHDQNRERWDAGAYLPLQHIKENQPQFLVIDSLLSEEAVLGFEYGYASSEPNDMVIWEAQFGDFANGAQVVIDQFISSGEAKWGRLCGLVLLLPHGYEGQGPEHSSARLERYLQLCAEHNMQVVVPSNPAQVFHMLRRQMIRPMRRPLIVMMPKSLLRRKESVSSLDDLAKGQFQNIIGETDANFDAKKARRVVFCGGKVYYDIVAERSVRNIKDIAVVRIEQLYPFPHEEFATQIKHYSSTKDICWAQEEPANQGAWHRVQHYLLQHMRDDQQLSFALRPSSASPAVGYLAKHNEQQKALVDAALTVK